MLPSAQRPVSHAWGGDLITSVSGRKASYPYLSPGAPHGGRRAITADRGLLQWALLAAALLLWPLLLFGEPAYFSDSASYYKGGRTAVAITLDRLQALIETAPDAQGSGAAAEAAAALGAAKGSRSVLYSLAAYLLSWPGVTMTLLAAAQALATGWVIAVAARLAGVRSWAGFAGVAAVVAFATPAAIFACYIVPDIFAGLLIASAVMLAVGFERLSLALRVSFAAIAAFAVTSHASHPPIAAGLLILCGAWVAWLRLPGTETARRTAWLAAPLVLGALTTVVTGFVGFGALSLAPKRFPLTLARSIEDGPARWYLAEHCGERRYAVCEVFGPKMPDTVPEFLWDDGLTGRATPEQMDRIRDEEGEIVAAAAREYPLAQAGIVAENVGAQITQIGLDEVSFDQELVIDERGALQAVETGANRRAALELVEWLSAATALAAALWLAWSVRRMRACDRAAAALLVAGLLGNAAVCAIFSGVADRYQARVVWLLPLFALVMIIGAAERARRPAAG